MRWTYSEVRSGEVSLGLEAFEEELSEVEFGSRSRKLNWTA